MTWTYEFELPYPVSVNRYWVPRKAYSKNGKAYSALMPSADGIAYKRNAGWAAKAAGVRLIEGPVEYEIDLYPERPQDWAKRAAADPLWWDLTVRCIDLDNARKVLQDALNGIAWTDDGLIRRDGGEIMEPDGRARCVVRVKPYVRVARQLTLVPVDPAERFRVTKPAPNLTTRERIDDLKQSLKEKPF